MKSAIIYIAISLIDGSRYIGVTSRSLHSRRLRHLSDARLNRCGRFFDKIREQGPEMIRFSVLAAHPSYELALREEVRLIATLRPELNMAIGGVGGFLGLKHSAEVRARISATQRGKRRSPEAIANMVATKINRPRTAAELAVCLAGIALAQETRRRAVLCLNNGVTYRSTTEAARALDVWQPTVSAVCLGKRKHVGGYSFVFAAKPREAGIKQGG